MGRKAPRTLIDNVNSQITDLLISKGYRKRSDGWFTIDLKPGFLGTVAISRNVEQGDRRLGIFPIIGVCCKEHRDYYAELDKGLRAGKPLQYQPTFTTPLYEIVPGKRPSIDWEFYERDDSTEKVKEVVDNIIKFGIIFMHENADLRVICEKFMANEGSAVMRRPTHLPIALALLGRKKEAKSILEKEVRKEKEEFQGTQHYMERFAERLLKKFDIQ